MKKLGQKLGLVFFAVAVTASASELVCVRNYMNKEGLIPCDRYPQFYAYVIPYDKKKDEKVCARIYSEFYCQGAKKEYVPVQTLEGRAICVLNNAQEPVLNYCRSLPQYYAFIVRHVDDAE